MATTTTVELGVQGAAVSIRDLHVRSGQRVLFDGAEATFEPGKITLIIGSSGVGKSVLLGILAGLYGRSHAGLKISGSVRIGEDDVLQPTGLFQLARKQAVGVVFQGFALFDEFSPEDNVRFAQSHCGRRKSRAAPSGVRPILDELNVPRRTPISHLSGGQQRRLAIARTLAYRPDVVLYDEPTSGLDPPTGRNVASLIRRTHEAHPTTSIIVTHDYASLTPIADRIYCVDPKNQSLREVDRADWPRLHEQLRSPDLPEPHDDRGIISWGKRLSRAAVRGAGDFLAGVSRVVEEIVLLPVRLTPLWRSWRWGMRYAVHYLGLVAGPSAWAYIAMAGAILGFVSTYFTFHFLPFENYTKPLLIEELLRSMGFALYRILTPVLATILIAARCGAAVASDVGGKVFSRQTDALRTFSAPPSRYLLTPILYAFLLGSPLLTAISYAAASAASLIVFTATHANRGPAFWTLHFHSALHESGSWFFVGTSWLLAKTLVCAVGIALVAYHRGMAEKNSSRDVSRGITTTILWATLYVLVVHFVFAFVEFE